MPSDFFTTHKDRIGIATNKNTLSLLIDREGMFVTVHLTHQEARRLAFKLQGSSDPYAEANEG